MLDYNEIAAKKYIEIDSEIYEVLSAQVMSKQQRRPVNQVKMRNIKTGKVVERNFHQSEKVEEPELNTVEVDFLYSRRGEAVFCISGDPSQRFTLKEEMFGESAKFLKPKQTVDVLVEGDEDEGNPSERVIEVKMPIKVTLEVTEAPPGVKGNTAQGGSKPVTLETGVSVNAPLFVNKGDKIVVNTQTGEYVGRA